MAVGQLAEHVQIVIGEEREVVAERLDALREQSDRLLCDGRRR
jgi:hypothetical protein